MAKRLSLREFQQNLIDQLQAENLSETRVSTLGVQLGGQKMLVDMADVAEVLPLPVLTTVPFTKTWFRGVTNIRGNLNTVIDLASFLQMGEASGDSNNRILLVSGRYSFNVAFLVDNVLGLRDSRNWQQRDVGGQIQYLDEQGAIWRRLDVAELLSQAEFLQIGI